jgi:hypothetical protein
MGGTLRPGGLSGAFGKDFAARADAPDRQARDLRKNAHRRGLVLEALMAKIRYTAFRPINGKSFSARTPCVPLAVGRKNWLHIGSDEAGPKNRSHTLGHGDLQAR